MNAKTKAATRANELDQLRARLRQAERRARENEERYALATSAAVEGIYEWDLQANTLFLTERAKAFFSITGEDLTPAAWNVRIHAEDYPGYRNALVAHFNGRTPHLEHEYRIADDRGSYRWILDRGIGVRDERGRVVKLVGALSDIDARKHAEQEIRARNRELSDALEQQTATSEILSVISQSPTNVQPVFDTMASSALTLCSASSVTVVTFDGKLIHAQAVASVSPEGAHAVRALFPRPPSRDITATRAIMDRRVVAIPDVLADPDFAHKPAAVAGGFRSTLAVPLVRDGAPIGAITVGRSAPGPFSDRHVALLRTFADQAVIAIENARLFAELQARNGELTEALERQTATSDILRVISRSPHDVQPVFDTIVAAAIRLCDANSTLVTTLDGDTLRLRACANADAQTALAMKRRYPRPRGRSTAMARAIETAGVVAIPDVFADAEYDVENATPQFRSVLGIPLLRDGTPIGAIGVGRADAGPFPDEQVALLQTFADQAVIAIDNVRLFTELDARNRALAEALEQQTATSDLLKVIGRSTFDLDPVFATLVDSAVRLCEAERGLIFRYDGSMLRFAAGRNVSAELRDFFDRHPLALTRASASGRAAVDRATVHIHDVRNDADYRYGGRDVDPYRTVLAVPMLKGDKLLGTITIYRHEVRPFRDSQVALMQTFADQAVIAIDNVRLFTELEARNRELTEALEQQTATSEILRVISESPTDVQPVFDAIAAAALKLCRATSGLVFTYDGKLIHLAASANVNSEAAGAWRSAFPRPASRDTAATRAVLTGTLVSIPDVLDDPDYVIGPMAAKTGFRSAVAVPLIRDGKPIGVLGAGRPEPGPFPPKQLALLQTFADQAVIAIENVRLFNETKEALERQTATSEILQVISSSRSDVQPVFDTIAAAALKLCGASSALVTTFDGELVHLAALANVDPAGTEAMRRTFPRPPGTDTTSTRAVFTRSIAVVPDVFEDPDYAVKDFATRAGFRSVVAVPLIREGAPIGTITVGRAKPGLFPDQQIALLQTFADQAVIAIENVRLLRELESRNRELTDALEQQTATGDILRVMSRSQTDVQPVFDTIAAAALKLCGGSSALVTTFDGELVHIGALAKLRPQGADGIRNAFPRPPSRETGATRAILTGRTVEIPDVLDDPDYATSVQALAGDFRSILSVPLVRNGATIGAISVGAPEPGPFPEKQKLLLRTFADQAVIAIENARLFRELESRTTELTRSVRELRALGEVGQAVSSTLDVETVLRTIVSRARELAGMDGGAIYEYDESREQFHLRATDNLADELVQMLRATPVPKGEGVIGALPVTREPVEVRDILHDAGYHSRVRDILIRLGYRSLLAVPLLREQHLIGGLIVNRAAPGEFAPQTIELLKTFATQSALAIHNARVYRELEAKSAELESASRHKSEFLANMSHELRTPLNAIIGFSEVLSERLFGELNGKQDEYVRDILESGRHLLSLINDILDLSKIEAGRMELDSSEFDLPSAIDNTLALVRERATRRGIALGHAFDARLGAIRADERKVKQVLLNLLSNALKFTPEGGRVEVRAALRDGTAEISVSDTGVGIAPEDQEAVFEEFRQVGSSGKKVEGTGLGLAISRKFVELHGGRIRVESAPGAGATFVVTLPLR